MRIEDRVIPARFLVTLGHLVGMALVFKTKSDNIYAGLSYDPTVAEVAAATSDVNVSTWYIQRVYTQANQEAPATHRASSNFEQISNQVLDSSVTFAHAWILHRLL